MHILVVYFCKKNLFLVFQIAFSFTYLSKSRKETACVNHYEEHPCPDITEMAWYLTKNNNCRWVTWILLLNILQACQILSNIEPFFHCNISPTFHFNISARGLYFPKEAYPLKSILVHKVAIGRFPFTKKFWIFRLGCKWTTPSSCSMCCSRPTRRSRLLEAV